MSTELFEQGEREQLREARAKIPWVKDGFCYCPKYKTRVPIRNNKCLCGEEV